MKRNTFIEQPRRGNTHEVQLTPDKAAGRGVWTVAAMLILAVFATSCDPSYTEEIAIHNGSSHTVTVIPSPLNWYDSIQDTTFTQENQAYTIAPGEEVVIWNDGGLGGADRTVAEYMFFQYYSDSVTFRFNGESGPQIIYHKEENTGISPYNFNSQYYQYEEGLNTGLVFHGHPNYGKLTFTITDEHYDAAMNDDE